MLPFGALGMVSPCPALPFLQGHPASQLPSQQGPGETCGPGVPLQELQGLRVSQAPFSRAVQGELSEAPGAASRAPQGLPAIMPKPRCLPSALVSPAEPRCPWRRGQRACI